MGSGKRFGRDRGDHKLNRAPTDKVAGTDHQLGPVVAPDIGYETPVSRLCVQVFTSTIQNVSIQVRLQEIGRIQPAFL